MQTPKLSRIVASLISSETRSRKESYGGNFEFGPLYLLDGFWHNGLTWRESPIKEEHKTAKLHLRVSSAQNKLYWSSSRQVHVLSLAQTLIHWKIPPGVAKGLKIYLLCPFFRKMSAQLTTQSIPFGIVVTRVHEKTPVHQPPAPVSRWEYAFGQKLTRVFLKLELERLSESQIL